MHNELIAFEENLSNAEKKFIHSLHELNDDLINNCFEFEFTTSNNIRLNVIDTSNVFCSFQIVFSRVDGASYLSFYIGYGAEVDCYIQIGKDDDQLLLADIDSFLRSNVRAECFYDSSGKIIKAIYYPDLLIRKIPGAFYTFREGYVLPFKKHTSRVINYRPWMQNGSG